LAIADLRVLFFLTTDFTDYHGSDFLLEWGSRPGQIAATTMEPMVISTPAPFQSKPPLFLIRATPVRHPWLEIS
jgi:hypothetical protein